MTSCQKNNQNNCFDSLNRQFLNYKDNFSINDIKNEFFNKNNKEYYIFFYKINCYYCDSLKGCLFDYLDKNLSPPIYLYEINKKEVQELFIINNSYTIEERKSYSINKSSLYDIYYFGSPSLYNIKENRLKNIYVGAKEINKILVDLIKI